MQLGYVMQVTAAQLAEELLELLPDYQLAHTGASRVTHHGLIMPTLRLGAGQQLRAGHASAGRPAHLLPPHSALPANSQPARPLQ